MPALTVPWNCGANESWKGRSRRGVACICGKALERKWLLIGSQRLHWSDRYSRREEHIRLTPENQILVLWMKLHVQKQELREFSGGRKCHHGRKWAGWARGPWPWIWTSYPRPWVCKRSMDPVVRMCGLGYIKSDIITELEPKSSISWNDMKSSSRVQQN